MLPENDDELILGKVIVTAATPIGVAKDVATALYNRLNGTEHRYSDIQDIALKTAFRRQAFEYLEWRIRRFEDHYQAELPQAAEYRPVIFAQIPRNGELGPSSKLRELIAATAENTTNV